MALEDGGNGLEEAITKSGILASPWQCQHILAGFGRANPKCSVQRTVSRALGHLQVEILGLVVFAHIVVNSADRGLNAVYASRLGRTSWRRKASKFAANNCVSRDVLEERGAGEVGCKEPHEQGSDSTGKGKRVRQSRGKLEKP